jgi:hypothetical protein
MHHSVKRGQLVYGRQQVHFANIMPTQQDAMIQFSLRFHDFFGVTPEKFPLLYRLFFNEQSVVQSWTPLTPSMVNALKYSLPGAQPREGPRSLVPIRAFDLAHHLGLSQVAQGFQPPHDQLLGAPGSLGPNLLEGLLQEFLGEPTALFKSPEQHQAIYLICSMVPSLILILPTGGGGEDTTLSHDI